jgi:hypothetical protein
MPRRETGDIARLTRTAGRFRKKIPAGIAEFAARSGTSIQSGVDPNYADFHQLNS